MNGVRRLSKPLTEQPVALEGMYVVRAYSLLAFLSLGIFGALHISEEPQVSLGYLELAGSAIILANLVLLYILHNIAIARNALLLTVLGFMIVMLVTGGTSDTGVFWFFVFPVAAFFLAGKQQGLWWMAALLTASVTTWLLGVNNVITIAYGNVTLRQLLASMLVVTIGIYAYQQSRERLVSQKDASQRELNSEKVRADEIVQHIGEGIVTTDANGVVTFANGAAQRLLGWSAEELKGKSFVEVIPMVDGSGTTVPAESRPMSRTLKSGKTAAATMTTAYRRKDGKVIPVSVTGTPMVVEGKVVGGIGTFRDVTEEQTTARAKSEFVTLASHQLRTPISAIAWVSELLLNGDAGKLSREQHEHVEGIYKSNQRMAALVGEMLLVSSLELGTLPVTPEETDLKKLAVKTLEEQIALQKSKDVAQVVEHYDTTLPPVQCDPEVAKILFANLLSNALKYTPKTGRITLEVTVDHHEKLHTGSKGSVVIRVTDTGYGIPENVTNKIFGKFFRAENIIHKDTDGTGLGLFIVKALLDYVGGQISFTSHENKGTTFTVLLPLEGMSKHKPKQQLMAKTKEATHV
jgi:PAS domain S-box-containing protein